MQELNSLFIETKNSSKEYKRPICSMRFLNSAISVHITCPAIIKFHEYIKTKFYYKIFLMVNAIVA